jgi:hypothetical protein
VSTPELVDVTTETTKTRHLARPGDLKPFLDVPGRFGQSLCHVNNLGGVFDQARLDDFTRKNSYRKPKRIADLPLCKRCARSAPVSQEGGKP